MNSKKLALALSLIAAFATTSALAETAWEKDHPRRDRVSDRLAHQNARIHHEVKEGEMTHKQAARLHKSHRQIRSEERAMASQNGGHITKPEQRALNQQENRLSRRIGE